MVASIKKPLILAAIARAKDIMKKGMTDNAVS